MLYLENVIFYDVNNIDIDRFSFLRGVNHVTSNYEHVPCIPPPRVLSFSEHILVNTRTAVKLPELLLLQTSGNKA